MSSSSKTRSVFNGGRWTKARFDAFIRSALRKASMKWPPKYEVRKAARVERGKYLCVGFKRKEHVVGASYKKGKRRLNNIAVDHISPISSSIRAGGIIDWSAFIERLFCEKENLQVLCAECHSKKTEEERNWNVTSR